VNVKRMAVYDRLMDAEELLDEVRERQGVSDMALGDALEVAETDDEEDVYVATLARYVAELGGRLEVRAVFPDEIVTLLRLPPAD
jgi:Mg-chelatase subunit ChlI